ncbi:MAG: putative terminase large subunit [Prokaryotic dsDNA virus sp.]|nr:MAG: putative terminase large subunit [Prokaryotic dsDNA virus sp.]
MDKLENYKQKWFDFVEYNPHPGQLLLHNPPKGEYHYKHNPAGSRFIVACCGRRFGKSYSAAREAEVVVTQPNKVVWIVAPSYNTSEKIFRIVYDELVVKKGYKPSHYSHKEQILKFDWSGGQSIVCGKSAEHPSGLIGEGCDLVILDEASKIPNLKRIWEMYVRPTLSDKKGRAIFISTPDGYGTFYELYLRGKTEPGWYSFNSPSWHNIFAFPDGEDDPDLQEARQTLSKEVYEQEYKAEFTSLSGRIYGDFTRHDNTGEYNYNYNLPTYLSLDFGYRMPAALFFQVAKGPDGLEHIYLVDEIIHKQNMRTLDLVNAIKAKNYRIVRVFGDPAGYQVQSSVGTGEAEIFYQMTGYRVYSVRDKASRNINSGISHVRNFILSTDGTRRLHISDRCQGIIEDIESYRYPESKDGKELKEAPLKDGISDHGCDALRYFFTNKFPIKNSNIRTHKR